MEHEIDKPLFSTIIPTYNHAIFIKKCLDSVVAQTYTNWEAIVVNNYSEDNTVELVNEYNDNRIRLINFKNNGIIAASRNTGIREAKGEWICFLDSDDWWEPTKLQACFEHINDHPDLVYHRLKIIGEVPFLFRRKTIRSWQVKTPVIIDMLVKSNPIANSSVVIRKRLLDQIGGVAENVEMVGCEDFNTWLRIAQISEAFMYIPQTLGAYMVHEASISLKDTSIPMRHACAEFMHLLNDQQKLKHESILRFAKGRFAFITGDYKAARKDLLFCLQYGDLFIKLKSAILFLASLITKR
jgi:glycosyltransferase involved in cell wall biosynthesis